MSEPRGVIFDLDGTLADTMPLHFEAWQAMCAKYGLVLTEDRFYALGGRPTKEVAKLLVAESGRDLDVDRISDEKERLFLTTIDRVTPIEPVIAEARKLRGRVPMAGRMAVRYAVHSRTVSDRPTLRTQGFAAGPSPDHASRRPFSHF